MYRTTVGGTIDRQVGAPVAVEVGHDRLVSGQAHWANAHWVTA